MSTSIMSASLKKSGRKRLLEIMSEDDTFYERSFALTDKLQENPEYYYEWTALLDGLDFLISKSAENRRFMGRIEYLKEKGRFVIENLVKCGEIIDEHLPDIENCG